MNPVENESNEAYLLRLQTIQKLNGACLDMLALVASRDVIAS